MVMFCEPELEIPMKWRWAIFEALIIYSLSFQDSLIVGNESWNCIADKFGGLWKFWST